MSSNPLPPEDIAPVIAPVVEDRVRSVTHEVLDLKLARLKSDLRLMIIASVALNQFLGSVSLPTAVSISAVIAALAAPAGKAAFVFLRS